MTLAGGAITAAAAATGQTLENSGNTIEGFGTIGDVTDGNLTLDNNTGTIEANSTTAPLIIATDNIITNSAGGTLEAASGATLQIDDIELDNRGNIQVDGTLAVERRLTLTLDKLGTVTLAGGAITAAAAAATGQTLENSGNTIEGFGTIGDVTDGNLTLDNNTGTIEANSTTAPLIIATDNIITNSAGGTLEAASGATLQIDDIELDNRGNIQVDGTLAVDAGTLTLDKLGTVTLAGGAITAAAAAAGQTLENSGNTIEGFGTIGDVTDGNLTLDNNTGTIEANSTTAPLIIATDNIITNSAGGTLEAASGATLQIDDIELDNRGNIQVDGTLAVDAGTLTLDKLGMVTLAGGAITAAAAGQTLENSGNTIEGFGTIGDAGNGDLTLHNDALGIIDATGTLTLDTGNPIVNSGLLEATDGGKLDIVDSVKGAGNIQIGNGSTVELGGTATNTVTFEGSTGTLQIDSTGGTSAYSVYGGGAEIQPGNTIYLQNISYNAAADHYNSTTDVLTVSNGTGETVKIDIVGGVGSGDNFLFKAGPGGNGTVAYDPAISTGSATPSVSVSGPDNETFVFHPSMGAETVSNFNPKVDTIELDHFASIHNVQQLASLITTDAQGGGVIELGHHDSITLPSVTATQLQAHLHSLVHLN